MSSRAQSASSQTAAENLPAAQTRARSRLGRLYLYSKDTAFTAQENFTTEALALAILDSAEPMLRAFRRMSTVAKCPFALGDVLALRPRTQVYISGGGFLDLVLDAYRREAKLHSRRVWLITLGPSPLRQDIPHLTWMDLYQAARTTRPEPASWVDLRKFLEEQMIANDAMGPISDREAASLEATFDLFQKVLKVILVVHRSFHEVFPLRIAQKIWWKNEGQLINGA